MAPLGSIVDLERFPIDDLRSPRGAAFVASCRAALESTGICQLHGFVRPDAVAEILALAAETTDKEWASESTHTVYFTEPDASLDEGHPLRRTVRSAKRALAWDRIPAGSPLKQLYQNDAMTAFVGAALGISPLYRSADPLDCCEIASFRPGQELGWHFDNSEFSVTLMLQEPESGGDFDYFPALRTDDRPNFDGVRRAIEGHPEGRVRISTGPGTLALFRGHRALHRVTKVEGQRTRINAVLTYGDRPDMRLSELTQRLFYGRAVGHGGEGARL
ncbi:2OG-Fe(II) oxygenase superfamily-domain-containing protein [Hyaloraphidium curvatum]|nr:2OG-Fe(II) oxygenase superfamily-domain-containing protein [Hyaloraphidium curvatum]